MLAFCFVWEVDRWLFLVAAMTTGRVRNDNYISKGSREIYHVTHVMKHMVGAAVLYTKFISRAQW